MTTVVASGSSSPAAPTQFADLVDLSDLLGAQVLFRPVRFDIEVRRTGGSGHVAVRQNRPMLLRTS